MNLEINQVLKKAMADNIPKRHCYYCKKPITNKRAKYYCHPNCAYDANKYSIKAKYKNHKYMYIYLGQGYDKGQGRRCGGMILGSMSAAQDMWSEPVLLTRENIQKSIWGSCSKINLCNSAWLSEGEAALLADYLSEIIENKHLDTC